MIQNLEELKKMAGQVRQRATLAQIEEIKGGVQTTFHLSFEVEGKENPLAWRKPFTDITP
jgi:hypothetical protein